MSVEHKKADGSEGDATGEGPGAPVREDLHSGGVRGCTSQQRRPGVCGSSGASGCGRVGVWACGRVGVWVEYGGAAGLGLGLRVYQLLGAVAARVARACALWGVHVHVHGGKERV